MKINVRLARFAIGLKNGERPRYRVGVGIVYCSALTLYASGTEGVAAAAITWFRACTATAGATGVATAAGAAEPPGVTAGLIEA